jgi:hypothetical protein
MIGKERPMKARPGEFDYQDARRFKHTRLGIWDLYEERQSHLPRIPTSSISETYTQIIQGVPFLVRMLKDVLRIKRCSMLLSAYLVVEVLTSLIPAVSLWCVITMLATSSYIHNVVAQVFWTTASPCNVLSTSIRTASLTCTR